jgi:hypothetical protein
MDPEAAWHAGCWESFVDEQRRAFIDSGSCPKVPPSEVVRMNGTRYAPDVNLIDPDTLLIASADVASGFFSIDAMYFEGWHCYHHSPVVGELVLPFTHEDWVGGPFFATSDSTSPDDDEGLGYAVMSGVGGGGSLISTVSYAWFCMDEISTPDPSDLGAPWRGSIFAHVERWEGYSGSNWLDDNPDDAVRMLDVFERIDGVACVFWGDDAVMGGDTG